MSRKRLRQNEATPETIKYLVRKRSGNFILEVPANYKLTFASVNPNSQGGMRGDGYCLRVYEGEKLRIVEADVTGFRDLSIPYAVEVRKETGSSTWEKDSTGNFSENVEIAVERHLEAEIVENPFDA